MELRGKASPEHHSGSFAMSQMHLVPCFQAKTCTEQKASFCLKKKKFIFQILSDPSQAELKFRGGTQEAYFLRSLS